MKQLRMYLIWPIIFAVCWYFFGFNVAAVIGLLYLHLMIVLLANLLDKHKAKLIQIVEYIAKKEGLNNEPLKNIFTGEDLV
ncbi:MAG: hypothetical protein WC654_07820 [Patescibacteria group bacterium]